MAALELHDTEGHVLKENIQRAIEGLEQPVQKVKIYCKIRYFEYCVFLLRSSLLRSHLLDVTQHVVTSGGNQQKYSL